MAERKSIKRKDKKVANHAVVYINATFNNTLISVCDLNGDVLLWSSTGVHGFKGSRKSTPFAGKITAEALMKDALSSGVKVVDVKICGPGSGRESTLRAIAASGLKINSIKDVTPIPHNGCRPPKRRRL